MLPSKDINFAGYTYRNMEIVNETQSPLGMSTLKPFAPIRAHHLPPFRVRRLLRGHLRGLGLSRGAVTQCHFHTFHKHHTRLCGAVWLGVAGPSVELKKKSKGKKPGLSSLLPSSRVRAWLVLHPGVPTSVVNCLAEKMFCRERVCELHSGCLP